MQKHVFNIFSKFPVFSLSGKMDFQIRCFPCAVATMIMSFPMGDIPVSGPMFLLGGTLVPHGGKCLRMRGTPGQDRVGAGGTSPSPRVQWRI